MNKLKFISDNMTLPAILEALAEECTELGQICLKMARKLRGENPTPRSTDEILADLHEEIADVLLCIDVLGNKEDLLIKDDIESIEMYKEDRWFERLTNK